MGPPPRLFPEDIAEQATAVVSALKQRAMLLCCAESCTGGMIAAALTSVPGASAVFDRGFVTYSNEAKSQMLGVPEDLLAHPGPGAVSAEVARAMAEGALSASNAGIAVAVTGIAGPDGGTPDKPVGLVYIACALSGSEGAVRRQIFAGNRHEIRHATVNAALDLVLRGLDTLDPAS